MGGVSRPKTPEQRAEDEARMVIVDQCEPYIPYMAEVMESVLLHYKALGMTQDEGLFFDGRLIPFGHTDSYIRNGIYEHGMTAFGRLAVILVQHCSTQTQTPTDKFNFSQLADKIKEGCQNLGIDYGTLEKIELANLHLLASAIAGDKHPFEKQ